MRCEVLESCTINLEVFVEYVYQVSRASVNNQANSNFLNNVENQKKKQISRLKKCPMFKFLPQAPAGGNEMLSYLN